ncbi:MAG: TonB-dependent receptor, partial [Saprospiraceae bacterium]
MQYIFLLFPCCFLWTTAAAQTGSTLEGGVADSSGIALPTATVMLLQARDSVLAAFGTTDPDGRFSLQNVAPGDYLLQINYLGYQNHSQQLVVPENKNRVNAGRILLQPASLVLPGVEIKAEQAPLVMRKDTLEYNAGVFKTQPGAVVEDLLKKLPGIQVQSDGTIKAQGETVQNVLVDGKEFFGQDPKVATKNLPADAVDKVQVYDKKSEQAEFTGIDDGREQKTINLQLKADKKQGYFGNASAGYGTQNRFEGKFNLNRFGGKTQFSALGMGNNTNQQGFSFDDYLNFMGGLSNLMSGSGGAGGRVRITVDPEAAGIPMGFGLENGFTDTWAGGLNINTELNAKTKLNASYFYSRLQNDMERSTSRTNLLGDQQFGSREEEDRLSRTAGHRLNLTLRHKPDSASNLTFRG